MAEPDGPYEDSEYLTRPPLPERLPADTLISKANPIHWPTGSLIEHLEDLPRYVEQPLLAACRDLFDKKVRTTESSANQHNLETGITRVIVEDEQVVATPIGGVAYVVIYYDGLSAENRAVAEEVGELTDRYNGQRFVNLNIPLSESSTIAEVEAAMLELAERFHQQKRWDCRPLSLSEAQKINFWTTGRPDQLSHQELIGTGRFEYDEEAGVYYVAD